MSKESDQVHLNVEEEHNVEGSPCKCGCDKPTLNIAPEIEPAACRITDLQLQQLQLRSQASSI